MEQDESTTAWDFWRSFTLSLKQARVEVVNGCVAEDDFVVHGL
jgi:hypothetical protein